jgi:hypothetical protein
MSDREQSNTNDDSNTNTDDQNTRDTQNQNNDSGRPRSQWTEEDWNAEINRLVRAAESKGVNKGKQAAADEAATRKAKEDNDFKTLLEKAEQERDAALLTARTTAARADAIDAASSAGAVKPGVVWKLIKDDIEFDDDGKATNVADLIKATKSDSPELFGEVKKETRKGDGGNRGNATSGNDMNDAIRKAILRQ